MTKSLKEIWPTNGLHSQGHRIQLSNVRFCFIKISSILGNSLAHHFWENWPTLYTDPDLKLIHSFKHSKTLSSLVFPNKGIIRFWHVIHHVKQIYFTYFSGSKRAPVWFFTMTGSAPALFSALWTSFHWKIPSVEIKSFFFYSLYHIRT